MTSFDATIHQLWVFPIKSCAGIALSQAQLTPTGLAWDRAWMVVDAEGKMVTQRDLPRMALIQPELRTDAASMQLKVRAAGMPELVLPLGLPVHMPCVEVRVWQDVVNAFDMGDAASRWLTEFLGASWGTLRLVRFDPSHVRLASATWTQEHKALNQFSDGFPLLVTSTASLDELNQRLRAQGHEAVDMRRFRANVVVSGVQAHDEDRVAYWHIATDSNNGVSTNGAATNEAATDVALKLVKPCARCPIPNIDPDTAQPHPSVADTLQRYRQDTRLDGKITFGVNAIMTQGIGQVLRVGQRVRADWVFD